MIEDLTEKVTLECLPGGGEGLHRGEERVSGKVPRLDSACPIEGIARRPAGLEQRERGGAWRREARQVTDGMVTKQLGPGA